MLTIRTTTALRLIDGDRIPPGAALDSYAGLGEVDAVWVRFRNAAGKVVCFELNADEWEAVNE